jgi:hypothetical protein
MVNRAYFNQISESLQVRKIRENTHMIRKLATLLCIITALIIVFLPLSYAVDEINRQSDMNYAEYDPEY